MVQLQPYINRLANDMNAMIAISSSQHCRPLGYVNRVARRSGVPSKDHEAYRAKRVQEQEPLDILQE